jgi:hypothetical protein
MYLRPHRQRSTLTHDHYNYNGKLLRPRALLPVPSHGIAPLHGAGQDPRWLGCLRLCQQPVLLEPAPANMALTAKRQPPTFRHENWCCQIHDVDPTLTPTTECVSLNWMLYESSHKATLVDGHQCDPTKFYREAQRYVPIDTTKWHRRLDASDSGIGEEEALDGYDPT